jgi:hypothetical protein
MSRRLAVGTMFSDEFDLLDIRLAEMAAADRYIIVESELSLSGQPKPLKFMDYLARRPPADGDTIKRFHYGTELFQHVAKLPTAGDNWGREAAQRNAIANGVNDYDDDDIIVITDIDEVIKGSVIQRLKNVGLPPGALCTLRLAASYLFLDTAGYYHLGWAKAMTVGTMRVLGGPQRALKEVESTRSIENAGWHFHFCLPPAKIVEKLATWSHSDWNTEAARQAIVPVRTQIRAALAADTTMDGTDIFGRSISGSLFGRMTPGISRVPVATLPKYVRDNLGQFSEVLL